MVVAVAAALFGVLVAGLWLIDHLDVLPDRHPLRKAHRKLIGLAIVASLLLAPQQFQRAVQWYANRKTAQVLEQVDDIQQRQLERSSP